MNDAVLLEDSEPLADIPEEGYSLGFAQISLFFAFHIIFKVGLAIFQEEV
jgi:hypothetical protein